MLDFLKLSQKRYTTKHYDATKKVSHEDLMTLLEILRNTPSSLNMQPWHFLVLDNQKEVSKILPAISAFNHDRMIDSSYTIIFCAKSPFTQKNMEIILEQEEKDERYSDSMIKQERFTQCEQSLFGSNKTQKEIEQWAKDQVFIALGAFLYAAESLNIDATAIGGFNKAQLDECLNLKQKHLKSVVLATIGYRSAQDKNADRPKSRLPLNEIFTMI